MADSDPGMCPSPEALGAFMEHTLDSASRLEIQGHLSTCPECIYVMGEASRVLADADEESDDSAEDDARRPQRRWPMAMAAGLTAVCLAATLYVAVRRDPLRSVREVAAKTSTRPVEGCLAGFHYAPYSAVRSGADRMDVRLRIEAERVSTMDSASAASSHARGVAALITKRHAVALRMLDDAVRLSPRKAAYWSDLSVAHLAADGGRKTTHLGAAQKAAERAIDLDRSLAAAHFNRALAMERLGIRRLAADAYGDCITLDPDSGWSIEAAKRRERLLP